MKSTKHSPKEQLAIKTEKCCKEIIKDIKKCNFKDSGRSVIEKMVHFIVREKSTAYGLKIANIKIILFGASRKIRLDALKNVNF